MSKKLFIVVNVDWFFVSHRLPIALAAKKKGYEVTIMAVEEGKKGDFIRSHGLKFIPLPTTRSGTNFWQELKVLWFLFKIYRKERPDIVHHVALKPVTYGSIVAKLLGIKKVVNALSGMGFLFINADQNKWLHRLVLAVFKYSFKNPNIRFILQNEDDLALIQQLNVLEKKQLFLIKGSGVDLKQYEYSKERREEKLRIVLPARMLWDKGVGEFVKAAKILHSKYQNQAEFILCGDVDMGNKAGVPKEQLKYWDKQNFIQWIGYQTDMTSIYKNAHIIVLPSYREGLPKSLIEACAIGRSIVTTNVPGCNAVVEDGVNGFLVESKNATDLAKAIEKLILDKNLRIKMGQAGRVKAEQLFSLKQVVEETMNIYEPIDLDISSLQNRNQYLVVS